MNFCPKCGSKLVKDASFCSECGYKIEKTDKNENKANQFQQPINLNIQPPQGYSNKAYSDINPQPISKYKQMMGFNGRTDKSFNTIGSTKGQMIGLIGMALTRHYVISFENNGLLVMETTKLGHFNGNNVFIPKNEIINLDHRNNLNYHTVIIKATQGKRIFHLWKDRSPKGSFQKENLKHINEILNNW